MTTEHQFPWLTIERPPTWKSALFSFNKKTAKGFMQCVNCKCKIKEIDDMTPLERMAMIRLINIRPQFCDKCREMLSAKWSEYMLNVWKLKKQYLEIRDAKKLQDANDNSVLLLERG